MTEQPPPFDGLEPQSAFSQPDPQPEPEPEPESQAEPQSEQPAEQQSEPEQQPDTTMPAQPQPDEPAPEIDPRPEPSVYRLPDSGPTPEASPEAAPEPTPEPAPEPTPEPAPEPAPEQATQPPAERPAPSRIPTPAAVAAVAAAHSAPAAFGRVDPDGTVWVRTASGERRVGAYPGASARDALIYYGRKYDDLAAQVLLLEQRVATTDMPAKEANASIARLRASVASAAAVGDLDALDARLDALVGTVEERRIAGDAARNRAREQARATKERISTEAETLASSTQWKSTGDRLRALLDEWKAAPRLDRKTDDELWKRFSAARTAFDKARRTHFAALDSQRDEARLRKERLVKEAESLAGSTDWAPTAQRYRDLMTEWKAAGRAGREEEETLWTRFRAAQDRFFAARSETFAERDAGQRANLEQKESLVAEAEALLPITDLKAVRRALRSINERWEAIGHVPRGDRDRIEGRLRKVEEAARQADESEWQRTNPEARARAEAAVSQLRASVAQLEAKAAKARQSGREREAAEAEAALEARRSWLAEAERTLSDLIR